MLRRANGHGLLVTLAAASLMACVLLVTAFATKTASAAELAQGSYPVDPKASFLHTSSNDAAAPPTIVNLTNAGFEPGDTLKVSIEIPSSFSYVGCGGPFVETASQVGLLGVFSSSNTLQAPSVLNRVPDAIDAGTDVQTGTTYFYSEPTDIPEDFRIYPPSEFLIEIPAGATHLFLGVSDSYYADNCGTLSVPLIQVDTSPPTIENLPANINAAATSSSGTTVSYQLPTATDDVDGSVPVSCSPTSGATFPLGTTTVSCSANDAAGNKTTKSFNVNVTYSLSGVLQPINGGSTPDFSDDTSSFRLGSTVPVKFKLSEENAGITDATAKLLYAKISDNVTGTEADAGTTAAASTDNLFRYDETNDQYIYNWGTKGLEAGTYQLRIDLGDGTTNTVRVSLK